MAFPASGGRRRDFKWRPCSDDVPVARRHRAIDTGAFRCGLFPESRLADFAPVAALGIVLLALVGVTVCSTCDYGCPPARGRRWEPARRAVRTGGLGRRADGRREPGRRAYEGRAANDLSDTHVRRRADAQRGAAPVLGWPRAMWRDAAARSLLGHGYRAGVLRPLPRRDAERPAVPRSRNVPPPGRPLSRRRRSSCAAPSRRPASGSTTTTCPTAGTTADAGHELRQGRGARATSFRGSLSQAPPGYEPARDALRTLVAST
jgi:hypothetical protein